MSNPKIVTDHKWKNFKYANEVPQGVLASEFDYQDRDHVVDEFFCYRGSWYHLDMFMRCELPGWSGYHGDTYFSGVLIKISHDGEQYQVGMMFC